MTDDEYRRDHGPDGDHAAGRGRSDRDGSRSAGATRPGPTSRSADAPSERPQVAAGAGTARSGPSPARSALWPEDYTPGRADYVCMTLLALSAVYGLAVMLARPALLGYNPLVLASLSGSRSALVTIGAQHAVGSASLAVVVAAFVLSTLSVIKLDLLFWWAGRLWGDFFLQSLIGDSKRKARQASRAEGLARRFEALAIIICNIPILPVPRSLVCAVLGISGTSFRKLLVVDLAAAAVVQALWLYLGYRIGEPVVQVVEVIARYSLWLTLAILAVIVVGAVRKARTTGGGDGTGAVATEEDGPTVDERRG